MQIQSIGNTRISRSHLREIGGMLTCPECKKPTHKEDARGTFYAQVRSFDSLDQDRLAGRIVWDFEVKRCSIECVQRWLARSGGDLRPVYEFDDPIWKPGETPPFAFRCTHDQEHRDENGQRLPWVQRWDTNIVMRIALKHTHTPALVSHVAFPCGCALNEWWRQPGAAEFDNAFETLRVMAVRAVSQPRAGAVWAKFDSINIPAPTKEQMDAWERTPWLRKYLGVIEKRLLIAA